MRAIGPMRFGVQFEIEECGRRLRSYFGRDPLIGAVLGGYYYVTGVLGSGGMCTVYRAGRGDPAGGAVAIKVLNPNLLTDEHAKQCFENEGRIMARLTSPHTLRLIDWGRLDNQRLFLVTELMLGRLLEELLRDGPISEARTLDIAAQICASMDELHGHGVVHCDLKPGNVFLEPFCREEVARVLDFGLARSMDGGPNELFGSVPPPESKVCGTPGFMSPEQIQGWRVDQRSDIYALGAIMYECLCGHPPFPPGSSASLLYRHVADKVPPFPASRGIDPELEGLVLRMLEKRPDRRPASAQEVLEAIRRLGLKPSIRLTPRRIAS